MSYDITSWKIGKVHLVLPLAFDFEAWLHTQPDEVKHGYENFGKRWCLEAGEKNTVQCNLAKNTWKLPVCGNEIKGVIDGQYLVAIELGGWTSDGSRHLYHDILIPLFKEFHGELQAVIVWESGDTISAINLHDGVLEEKNLT